MLSRNSCSSIKIASGKCLMSRNLRYDDVRDHEYRPSSVYTIHLSFMHFCDVLRGLQRPWRDNLLGLIARTHLFKRCLSLAFSLSFSRILGHDYMMTIPCSARTPSWSLVRTDRVLSRPFVTWQRFFVDSEVDPVMQCMTGEETYFLDIFESLSTVFSFERENNFAQGYVSLSLSPTACPSPTRIHG